MEAADWLHRNEEDMKCPKCGCEIAEGHLYCESCGMEIRMVPDFEPEIENSITETLSTVAEEIESGDSSEKSGKTYLKRNKKKEKGEGKNGGQKNAGKKNDRQWFVVCLSAFIVVIVIIVLAAAYAYRRYSVPYQVGQARAYAEAGDYAVAIEYLERARSLRSDMAELVFLESDYCYRAGDKSRAAEILLTLTGKEYLEHEDRERLYQSIIEIYDEEGRYEDISNLLLDCGDDGIVNQFQQYLAMPPEFGYEAGSYDEVITLKLSSNAAGTIYYTTDGSEPDERSLVYTAPLILESGDYQIAAVFINEYGIRSETARNWYVINLTAPKEPEIPLISGTYNAPVKIEVIVPENSTVYYTTNGTGPDAYSAKYDGPIPMPLGKTNFKFVAISEEGVSSEVVSRSYDLSLETEVTLTRAVNIIEDALYRRGVLSDLQGHSYGIEGKYVFKYDSIVEIPNLGYYYILNEYVEDHSGNQTKTEHLYAVEVYTGAPNRLIYDENGQMGLISLK
ncbi:MAG: chitobiase/beta-hexosaminidase C-terminal domain-containing protein [Clostridium sp.]|nr:chitobiase/beta-hexosaminidase C-terminal domain-containing protein [Clostridium sp.]